jgi:hypothetical protein
MRSALAGLFAAGAFVLAVAPAASADNVTPRSAPALRDSVGVVTHVVYYSTAYGDWSRAVARLEELGVRHVRDGIYANPDWRDWNERYYQAVELAAARGIRFNFWISPPGANTGTLDQVLGVIAGRLRHAAEAVEAPNEMDKYVGGPNWAQSLAAYNRELYRKVKANPALHSLPVLGPSFGTFGGPQRAGDLSRWMDVANVHPYTGAESPSPGHVRSELVRASVTAGRGKPVWATEAGYNNAVNARGNELAPVSEQAGAVYTLRTVLEHFRAGIRRTYLHELVDQEPEPARRDAIQHFGLLRHDFSPKPAYTALKNLLALTGSDGRPALRPLRLSVKGGGADLRRLVLRKADGSYLVVLWRLASVWDPQKRRPLHVKPTAVELALPGGGEVAGADPVESARLRPLKLRRGRVRVQLGAHPAVIQVTPKRALRPHRR